MRILGHLLLWAGFLAGSYLTVSPRTARESNTSKRLLLTPKRSKDLNFRTCQRLKSLKMVGI